MSRIRMSRRSLLGGALAAGAGLLVAACGQAAPPTPAPAKPAEPTAPAPKPAAAAPTQAPAAATPSAAATKPAAAPTTAPAATAAGPAAAAPAKAGTKTNVRWWMASTGDDLKAFGIAPQKYASMHPEVTVEIASIPQGGLTKVQAAIAAGDPPDMVQSWDRFNASGIYYKGGIQALDDYIKGDGDFDIKQLNPISVAGCQTFDGKQFALPDQDYVVSNIFFNTKLFKEKGLDPAKPPETLDDLIRVGEMFDVKSGDQYTQVGYHPLLFTDAQTYGFAFGGKFWDKEKGKITPDDSGVVAGLEWLLKRFQKYGVDTLRRIQAAYGQSQSAQNPFLAGQVALTAFWDAMSAYRNRYAPAVEYDQAWFPYGKPEAKGFGNMGFNPTWIAKDSKVKDVAWQLLKFNSMDLDSIVQTSILLGNTPHNLKGLTSPAAEKADPILRKSWEYAKNGKMNYFPPNVPAAAEFSQEWGRQVELILAGKQTIKEGVQKVIDVVQPQVDKGLKGG